MPIWDQLQIIKPNGDYEFQLLDSNKGIINIGRASQNDVVINNPEVRPFHALLDYREKPAQFIILNLDTTASQSSSNSGTLKIGGYIPVFLEGNNATANTSSLPTLTNDPLNFELTSTQLPLQLINLVSGLNAELSTSMLITDVEKTTATHLVVINEARYETQFIVEVTGLDQSWVSLSASEITLSPDEQQTITIAITPPRLSSSGAGAHPFMVSITPSAYLGQACCFQSNLTINPYYDFSVSEPTPKRQVVFWSKPSAQYAILVTNRGNSQTLFQLMGNDIEAACKFEFDLPNEATGLTGP